jgi:hypothetical protein
MCEKSPNLITLVRMWKSGKYWNRARVGGAVAVAAVAVGAALAEASFRDFKAGIHQSRFLLKCFCGKCLFTYRTINQNQPCIL